MKLDVVDIDFYLNDSKFAGRSWPQVPRVGDTVMLGPKVSERPRVLTPYRVTRVVWGLEEPNPYRQVVALDIELIKVEKS